MILWLFVVAALAVYLFNPVSAYVKRVIKNSKAAPAEEE